MTSLDWDGLTLFLFILMRMSGFVLFNPFFGRNNVPQFFRAGFALLLSMVVSFSYTGTVAVPATFIELAVRLLLEVAMGMAMAQTYDPSFQGQATPAGNVLNIFTILLFFTANGHQTLLRLMLDSGAVVPFGGAAIGEAAADKIAGLFIDCMLLAVKLCLPVLGAELMGQVGMGVLMKAIPQINVFAINIELKVLVGIVMLFFLIAPFSEFLLEMENTMLMEIERAIALAGGG